MNLVKYISELLSESDCVILPGLGGFVGNYLSAEIHPITHIFTPPAKSIAFNARLTTNDGLLANYIAKLEDTTIAEVQTRIEAFVSSIKKEIKDSNQFVVEGIGRLFLNENNSVQFEPEKERYQLAEAFGCEEFFAKPIEREESIKLRNISTDLMSNPERPKRPVKRVAGKPAMRQKVPVEKRKVVKKSNEVKEKSKSSGGKTWLWLSLAIALMIGGAGFFFVNSESNLSFSSLGLWKKSSDDVEVVDMDGETSSESITADDTEWDSDEASAISDVETDSEEATETEEASMASDMDSGEDDSSESSEDATSDIEEGEEDDNSDMASEDDSETSSDLDENEDSTSEDVEEVEEKGFFAGLMDKVKGWFGMTPEEVESTEDVNISKGNGWEEATAESSDDEASATEEESANEEEEKEEETQDEAQSEPVVKPSVASAGAVISSRTNRYYVIAGAFENPENAKKFSQTLVDRGYNSKILEPRGVKNVHRVTIADFGTQSAGLNKVSEENAEFGNALWVLKY